MSHTDRVQFSVQLKQAYGYEMSVHRRARTDQDPKEASLAAGPRTYSHDSTNRTIVVLIGADIEFPIGDAGIADVSCSVLGSFSYIGEIEADLLNVFPGREGLVILWPYLRSCVAQLGAMTGLQLPVIPTLDVMAVRGEKTETAVGLE